MEKLKTTTCNWVSLETYNVHREAAERNLAEIKQKIRGKKQVLVPHPELSKTFIVKYL